MSGKKKELLEQPVPETVLEEQEAEQVEVIGAEEPDMNELLAAMDEGEGLEAEPAAVQEDSEQPKAKKTSRKRSTPKEEEEAEGQDTEVLAETEKDMETVPEELLSESIPAETAEMPEDTDSKDEKELQSEPAVAAPRRTARVREAPVLTIENRGEVKTQEAKEDIIWHEIHNAYRTRRMLTGRLGGIESTDTGKTVVIVDYKGFRIVIPMKEMMINVGRSPSGQEYAELMQRQNKILGNMLGAEMDFIVKGIDSKTRSVVASRKEAMLKKRQIFYLDTDAVGMHRIYENRIVQARIIAVAEKVVRIEAFGVECSIMARDLAWDWIGDAHERFFVGDQVLVRILSVKRDSLEELSIKADIKSVTQNTNQENLKKCRIQSKYAGTITDVHKGVVYIRLNNGVNAVAHACYDYRTPGKKDEVSFAVTRIDEERGVAVGIITRIIRQQL